MSTLAILMQQCAPAVHPDTMQRIVHLESSLNPYAIGVVGAHLQHQPRSREEALSTITWLDQHGYNYSIGLAQINKENLSRYGLTAAAALEPCPNLRAASDNLSGCYRNASAQLPAQLALRAALSCYESGNFHTGLRDGYVRRIEQADMPPNPAYMATAARPAGHSAATFVTHSNANRTTRKAAAPGTVANPQTGPPGQGNDQNVLAF